MIQFEHTYYLWALAAVPLMVVLYSFVNKWKQKTIKKIGDEALVKQLIKDYSPSKFTLKFFLLLIAFIGGVIALANPRSPQGSTNVNRNGIDVMIALDVSKSMLANDIQPNRLERAKQLLARLIDKLASDRVGIVVFAGRAYLQMPLTSDHAAAKMYLSSASTDIVPTQGTVIGDALKMCYSSFNAKEKKYRTIILISDGEDHDEEAIKIAKALADEGVLINTIGIGSTTGSTILDPATNEVKKDTEGNPVITKLNETELQQIATTGNGIYQLFTNADDVVAKLDEQLKGMGQRTVTEQSLINYRNYFPYFLGLALLLLLVELFISEKKRIIQNNKTLVKKVVPAGLLLLFGISTSFGQTTNKLLRKGNEAYQEKKYDVAAENYRKVTATTPGNEKAQFNLGNALYKNGKTDDALQSYDAAIQSSQSPNDKAAAWYNKGVVLQNNNKLPECIEAYKNALRLNPNDEDARQNLQKALQQQKRQQEKEKNDKEKKKPKKDQQQKDKNEQPKPQPSKMTKQEAEEKLKALLQQEKNLQDKLKRVNANSPEKPEKDW